MITFNFIGQLEQRMREIFSIPQELNCRLWHRDSLYKFVYKLVTCDPSWIVQDAGFEKREVLKKISILIMYLCNDNYRNN